MSPSPHLKKKRSSFRNVVFSSYLDYRMKDKAYKSSDFVIHYRQNPLDSKTSSFRNM
jgi:hypothetical protein